MPVPNNGEKDEKKVETPPAPTPGANGDEDQIDFEKELENLESGGAPTTPPGVTPRKSKDEELKQAEYTLKSTAKRIKDLGGDPTKVITTESPVTPPTPETPALDTSNFVTKDDLAVQKARELAKSEGEFRVMMWYVRNKAMSVEDAHFLANKNKFKKVAAEINRANGVTPSKGGGGPGQDRPIDTKSKAPELPTIDKQRLAASGMVWNEQAQAYIGKAVQYRWADNQWVTERISKSK